nr:TolC family protein [uncultured Carboxylicivirga sp.]
MMLFKRIIKLWIVSVVLLGSTHILGQTIQQTSLDSCLQCALKNYPLISHAGYIQERSNNSIKLIKADRLPQLSLASEATFQSEAMGFEIEGFPAMTTPKDNYSFGLHLNQVLCDFGKLNQQKTVERAQANSEIQRNEIELYRLRFTIVQLYSQILLSKENIKILDSYIDNIEIRYKDMESAVANGVVLQSNLDILYAEMQRTNQRLINAEADMVSTEQKLSLYTRIQFDTATVFMPINESQLFASENAIRPELKLYDAQLKVLDSQKLLENRNKAPRLYLFGEGAYGRPGYDPLNENLRLYGTIGIGLRWNLNSFHTNSINSQNLNINKDIVEEQRSLFKLKQNSDLIEQKNNINRYNKLIETDASILEKLISITETSADQLENGIITSTDYLTQLYAQKQAELNKQIHIMQLQLAITEYNLIAGTN